MLRKDKRQLILQYAAGITASLTAGGCGSAMSWSSPGLSYLTSTKSYLPITKQQSDCAASLLTMGFILGFVLNPIIIGRLGRKWTLLLFGLPQIVSWILIIVASNIMTIYIARVTCGLGYGGGLCALTVYISEIGSEKNRGIFLVLISALSNGGALYALLLGAYLPYNYMNFSHLALPVTFVVIFFFMPDSSYFYEENNRIEEKMPGLMNLQELEEDESKNESKLIESKKQKIGNIHTSKIKLRDTSVWKLLTSSSNLKALLITSITAFVCVFSGNIPLTFFTQQIFAYSESTLNSETSAIVLAAVKTIVAILSTQIIERIRRKTLFFITGMIGAISMILMGIFFFLDEQQFDVSHFRWIPLFAMILYVSMAITGPCNLFFVYQAELFPSDVKCVAIPFGKIIYMGLSYLSLFRFQEIVNDWGVYTVFFFFATSGAVGTFIVCIITPETKGKRLNEIQIMLKRKRIFFC